MIQPEIREFIRQLRAGKSSDDAMKNYCWAKCVLPIRREDWEGTKRMPPNRKVVAWGCSMAPAMAADKFYEGGTDDEIADAFREGLAIDHERGILWRTMGKDERPTADVLVKAMGDNELNKLGKLTSYGHVARMLAP